MFLIAALQSGCRKARGAALCAYVAVTTLSHEKDGFNDSQAQASFPRRNATQVV